MENAAHIRPDRRVQAKLLRNSRHFICRKHDTQAQEHIILECQHAQEQQGCLHERSQADGNRLLAPLVETVNISSGNREHIKASHGNLHQQNPTALNVGKEDFEAQ